MSLSGFNRTLSWTQHFTQLDDPPPGKDHLVAYTVAPAGTHGGLQAKKNTDTGLYYLKSSSIDVRVKMNKQESWVLKSHKSDELRKHEQYHYNVSALAGRDLERGLKDLRADSPEKLMQEVADLTSRILGLVDKINEEYDNDILWGTDHGRTELHQGFWEYHIDKLKNDPNGELKSIYYVMER